MRRIVVSQFVSLDGVIEDPVGIESLGRGASAWPERGGDYADRINGMPKYVVSSTLRNPEWNNTTVLSGDAADEVSRLKDQPGGDILVHGSAQLTDTLMEHGLVDEWRLMVYPTVVGRGRRCFGDPGRAVALELVDSQAVGDGVAIMVYRPTRN